VDLNVTLRVLYVKFAVGKAESVPAATSTRERGQFSMIARTGLASARLDEIWRLSVR